MSTSGAQPTGAPDPEELRVQMLERWEHAASGWGKRADRVRAFGMPVSAWLIDHLDLQPGQRVLELAAGPGDTGFMAAELIRPGGTLITSDAAEAMLSVARERARELGIENVEFKRLELEWIDLPTASVDAIVCRWGVMLCVDPEAAAREARRVLRPGGRIAVAVWAEPARNPWATIPARALTEHGHLEPPDPSLPGMFALAAPGALGELLEAAGFGEVIVDTVAVQRAYTGADEYIAETLDMSMIFGEAYRALTADQQAAVRATIEELAAPSPGEERVTLPGVALVAAASA
jgi:SAM-dependent methyltransferase